jgi:DNA-3-methyladenine glycosylase II
MAAYMGKDVSKLKAKGGGKWKYMSENDMLEHSSKFAPYRFVTARPFEAFWIADSIPRSIFMWYMWRVEGVNVEAMQNA